MEEDDVGEDSREGREVEAVGQDEEGGEVHGTNLGVALGVEAKGLRVDDACGVVSPARSVEDAGRDEGEAFGVVGVGPVGDRDENIEEEQEAGHDIEDSVTRGGDGAAQVAADGCPVEAKGADAQSPVAGGQLLGEDRVLPDDAADGEGGDEGEKVVGDDVVGEADDEEELQPRRPSPTPHLLLMQRSAIILPVFTHRTCIDTNKEPGM